MSISVVDEKIRASDKDLPVFDIQHAFRIKIPC